jgi:apolipoprotein N-acyltransferase
MRFFLCFFSNIPTERPIIGKNKIYYNIIGILKRIRLPEIDRPRKEKYYIYLRRRLIMINEKWMHISSDLIQAVMFFLGILFALNKSNPYVVWLLIVSFFMFVTTLNGNSKLIEIEDEDEKKRINTFIEIMYGIGFTSLVCSILIIVYILVDILCVLVSFGSILAIMIAYSRVIYRKGIFRIGKNLIWLAIESTLIIFLILDFYEVLLWI